MKNSEIVLYHQAEYIIEEDLEDSYIEGFEDRAIDHLESIASSNFRTDNYCVEGSEACAIDHLESVTFSNFKGLRAELDMVKFLLGCPPLLKTMSIHFGGAMEKDVEITVTEEVFQYFIASSRVQIIYLEHRVDFEDFGEFLQDPQQKFREFCTNWCSNNVLLVP